MKTIWKYQLTSTVSSVHMPKGAKILTCFLQFGIVCIWALVNPQSDSEVRTFQVYPTGGEMPEHPGKYIGTFFPNEGTYVFHVFETTV